MTEDVQLGLYHMAVLALLSQKPELRIAVIGANDGKHGDPLHDLLKGPLAGRVELLLFEPQADLLPHLEANLAFVEKKRLFNLAVGAPGEVTLHRIAEAHWAELQPPYAANWPLYRAPTGVTSIHKQQLCAWIAKLRPELNPEEMIETLRVPSRPLAAALEAEGLPPELDVLQVDVEGDDDTVLYNSDLERTRPAVINAETEHLGIPRIQKLFAYLEGAGYFLVGLQGEILALRRE